MLVKLAAFGTLGYFGYRFWKGDKSANPPAFAAGQGAQGNATQIRDAGAEAMADPPAGWSRLDEVVDQSFPASDPPANY